MQAAQAEETARRLVAWYRRARRDLPWRRTRDPYAIWVSEVMLQQTRVGVVAPYYERFLARFPTLAALAAAGEDEVLAAWSGLGYYRRARSLQAAARACLEEHGGQVPRTAETFGRLPGVGGYTRAAVLSIAFGQRLAAVDGNVERVLARWLHLPGRARSPRLRRAVERAAGALVAAAASPGDLNQALMELGATVCTPRAPRCAACCLGPVCAAAAAGDAARRPLPALRRPGRDVAWEAAWLVERGRVLVGRVPEERGRFRGMWELPWGSPTLAAAALPVVAGEVLGRVRHQIVGDRIEVVVRRARRARRQVRLDRGRYAWVPPAELEGLPLASVWKKAIALAEAA